MRGLLLKDFYMIMKYCWSVLLVAVFFVAITLFGSQQSFFYIFPVIILSELPTMIYLQDEHAKWTVYGETLPYTRAQIVSSKYIIGLISCGSGVLIAAAVQAVGAMRTGSFDFSSGVVGLAFMFSIGLITSAVMMPFVFRFGAAKGRIAYLVVTCIACGGVAALASVDRDLFEITGSSVLSDMPPVAVIVFAALLVYACSWGISVFLYKRRELG